MEANDALLQNYIQNDYEIIELAGNFAIINVAEFSIHLNLSPVILYLDIRSITSNVLPLNCVYIRRRRRGENKLDAKCELIN